MQRKIELSKQESSLRQLLLDVSEFIGSGKGCPQPQLRFAGGWVRDKLLGLGSKDIDIAISSMVGLEFGELLQEYLLLPEARAKYPESKIGKLAKIAANPEASKDLETATTKLLGLDIDLVNLRKETYRVDSRNPKVEFGTPKEDAQRRDATVNALFYNLHTSEVEDFTGRGLEDLERKIIKTPLSPWQTFEDDPLRVLRAIRFSSRFGFEIATEDQKAIADKKIHDSFKTKGITRERVGTELTKMLQGNNPREALRLIDQLGLYGTLFKTSNHVVPQLVRTQTWNKAYDLLDALIKSSPENAKSRDSMNVIKSALLETGGDNYKMWLLCAFVPWARVMPPASDTNGRPPPRPAVTAAQEGIKTDKRSTRLIGSAVTFLPEIISIKDKAVDGTPSTSSPLKRKQEPLTRETFGMAIRRWGPDWRDCVMYALLTQAREDTAEDPHELLQGYAAWLANLKDLDLLNADQLKPLVKGNELSKDLAVKEGPWVAKALEMVVAWQLRNPGVTDPADAISEIKSRRRDLGLG
ncbi:MAG: hypothetical protein Q9220_005390 [cf. Caloplaca sp. 1 TL-2023]